jgi:DNA repair exonuclease SbcCD ATPase subunit
VFKNKKQVLLISAGVFLAATIVFQWISSFQLNKQYRWALEGRHSLELELTEVRTDRNRLSEAVIVEQQRVGELSATLSAKDTQLQEVISRLSEEEKVIQDLNGKLQAMQGQMDHLQAELAMSLKNKQTSSSKDSGKAVQLEKVLVAPVSSPGQGLQGHVVSINPEWSFIVIDLGWNVVNIGDVVSIYRNSQILGKARIERVQEQVCAATLLPEWNGAEIQINDEVRVF